MCLMEIIGRAINIGLWVGGGAIVLVGMAYVMKDEEPR